MTDLKAVFLGTSAFSVPSLHALHHDPSIAIAAVVSMPDRPAGRGRKLSKPPAAQAAQELGARLLQPEKLPEIREVIGFLAPSVMVSASYGGWIPGWFLDLAPLGVVNIHPSLLPRHRGASPVIRTILEGDRETGVSFMKTDDGWDTGDIIHVVGTRVADTDTAGELEARLAVIAAAELPEVLLKYAGGLLKPFPQQGEATYAEKVSPAEAAIEWSATCSDIERMVMAYNPVPGARTAFRGGFLKIHRARALPGSHMAGTVVQTEPLVVGCGSGVLELLEVQPPGKRSMRASDFVRGWRLKPGDSFESS